MTTRPAGSGFVSEAANATVSAADRARANHTGMQSADTVVDGTENKAYTAEEKTKLAGVATAATANRADSAVDTLLAAKADLVGGVVPTAQIPSLALVTAVPVANQAAMLALTSIQVQPGDLAIRTDGAGTFILVATDPSQLANWVHLNAPTDAVTTVNGQVGTVALSKTDVGLGNVDNTSDANKPVSTAQATALATKANSAALAPVATSGAYADLTGKPTATAGDATLFNVINEGAVADGTTDCTTAFQSAFTKAIAVNGTVHIPTSATATGYKITATININPSAGGQASIRVTSGGGNAAQILWAGGSNTAIFKSTGALLGCDFANIKIRIQNSSTGVVAWDFNTSVGGYFNASTWRTCRVDLGTGINNVGWRLDHTSGTGADVSFLTWDNCSVAGGGSTAGVTIAGQRGWITEGANALNYVWTDGGGFFLEKMVTNVSDTGATSPQGGGSLYFYGMGAGYNGTDFEFGNFGSYLISGGRFELGGTFMNVTYGGNSPVITVDTATISDYSAPSGWLFRLSRPASLQLRNLTVDGASADYGPQLVYAGGPAAGNVLIEGGVYSAPDPFWATYPGDPVWDFVSRQVSTINRNDITRTGKVLSNSGALLPANLQTGTAYTLTRADPGLVVEMNNAAANTVTIPTNATTPLPIGTVIEVYQVGAGQTTIAAASGVTLRAPAGAKISAQYGTASLRQRAANEWVVTGSTTV